jgi:hypothetical protein
MERLNDLATLFLRIAEELDKAGEESGADDLMVAADARFWRQAAEIIREEIAVEEIDPDTTYN